MNSIPETTPGSWRLMVEQASHPGLEREINEDAFGWFTLPQGELLIVADGLGGAAGGDEASRAAVAAFHQGLVEAGEPNPGTPESRLKEALLAADRAVSRRGEEEPALAGLGSTLVALLLRGREGWFVHAGDSRLYRFSSGRLEALTRDHSYVQELLEAGRLTPAQAAGHEDRHIVTQSLGGNLNPERLSVGHIAVRPGDIFLLCTDGLHDVAPEAEIRRLLAGSASPHGKAKSLIEAALKAGGPDNVTLQLVFVPPVKYAAPAERITERLKARPESGRGRPWPAIGLTVLGLLLVVGGWFLWSRLFTPLPVTPTQEEQAATEPAGVEGGETEPPLAAPPLAEPSLTAPTVETPAAEPPTAAPVPATPVPATPSPASKPAEAAP